MLCKSKVLEKSVIYIVVEVCVYVCTLHVGECNRCWCLYLYINIIYIFKAMVQIKTFG